jgi:predicted NAD-dependent protein-ADP-ribosyltransferase YbiA (DUF1768 family)
MQEVPNKKKDEIMLELLRQKFSIPKYQKLLLQTGGRDLHEMKGRGEANRYEFHSLSPSQKKENEELVAANKEPRWETDVLGKMLMKIRSEIRALPGHAYQQHSKIIKKTRVDQKLQGGGR